MNLLENQRKADEISGLYQDLEERLMANIIRHCRDYGQPIATDRWQMQRLAEIGKLNQENLKIIAQASGVSQTAMERMLSGTADQAVKEIEPAMRYLAREGLAGNAAAAGKSKGIKQAVSGLQKQAKDMLNLCNTTMLYKARDAYKGFVQKLAGSAKEIEGKQDFLDTLNKNASAAVLGAESRQQAVRRCIREFAEKGIPAFVDKRGREWTPEAYVSMAVRNTIKNTADEVQTARCKDCGVHLIEIDSHSGARPKCAKDQGKIFDLNNQSGYTEDANGRKVRYYPWNSSSYGEPDGILGINCTHHKWPFFPGMSLQSYFPVEDQEASDRLYKQTQVQRALERDVRKQKRECMLFDEIGDREGFEAAAVKLKQKEAKLKAYVDGNDQLHRRKDREQVVGFDKRVSAKAVEKAQKHYRDWAKSIGAESGPKNLAGYYDLKYNKDTKESRLYRGYVEAVNKGRISPLVGYDQFKEIAKKAEAEFIGIRTSDGAQVKGITAHFVDRMIGQQSADSPPRSGIRNGVGSDDIRDALLNPKKIGSIMEKDNGKRSKVYYGVNAAVSYNPDTEELIQVQPKRTK